MKYGWALTQAVKHTGVRRVVLAFLTSLDWQIFVLLAFSFDDWRVTCGALLLLSVGTAASASVQKVLKKRGEVVSRVLSLTVWIALTVVDNQYARMTLGFLIGLCRVDSLHTQQKENIHGTSILHTVVQILPSLLANFLSGRKAQDYAFSMIFLTLAQLILTTTGPVHEEKEEEDERETLPIGNPMVWCTLFFLTTTKNNEFSASAFATYGWMAVLLAVAIISLLLLDFIEAADYKKIMPPSTWGAGALFLCDLFFTLFDTPEVLIARRVLHAIGMAVTVLFAVVSFYLRCLHTQQQTYWHSPVVIAFCVYTRALDPAVSLWHLIWLGMSLANLEYEQFRSTPESNQVWASVRQNQFQLLNQLPSSFELSAGGEVFMDEDDDISLFSSSDNGQRS
jgi:hypothetical protein